MCDRHRCRKGPRWFDLCQSDPDIFSKYEAGEGPGQITLPPAARLVAEPTAEHFPCVFRGKPVRTGTCDLCGLKGQAFEVLVCNKFGECSIARKHSKVRSCVACTDRSDQQIKSTFKPVPAHQFLKDHNGDRATGWFNIFRGGSAFLICGGPSLERTPIHLLRNPGLLTAAVNNAAVIHRPHIWFSVDVPGHFSEAILRDSGIAKFLMWKHNSERLTRWDPQSQSHLQIETRARDLPNVWFYEHARGFEANQFLIQPQPTWGWGGAPGEKAGLPCDVMLPALRILHWMGIRTLYLVGADFEMNAQRPYAFDERSTKSRANWNNRKFRLLNDMFHQMREHFSEYGFKVFNCATGGNLTAFPRIRLEAAVDTALKEAEYPKEIVTRGMYVEK
jgi:hypothetical protein